MSEEEQSLFVNCPVCAEELEIPSEAWDEFEEGDILVCESCGAELQIASLDPPEFDLLGLLTECPSCGAEIELTDEQLEENSKVTCPDCNTTFNVEFEDAE